mmetsp:Transcript_16389/g.39307  ORF Transcript_16389/g.39307 Transcript_16389/m.39307 type:complete len:291 (-) Transcript_16389:4132-5004(-)
MSGSLWVPSKLLVLLASAAVALAVGVGAVGIPGTTAESLRCACVAMPAKYCSSADVCPLGSGPASADNLRGWLAAAGWEEWGRFEASWFSSAISTKYCSAAACSSRLSSSPPRACEALRLYLLSERRRPPFTRSSLRITSSSSSEISPPDDPRSNSSSGVHSGTCSPSLASFEVRRPFSASSALLRRPLPSNVHSGACDSSVWNTASQLRRWPFIFLSARFPPNSSMLLREPLSPFLATILLPSSPSSLPSSPPRISPAGSLSTGILLKLCAPSDPCFGELPPLPRLPWL